MTKFGYKLVLHKNMKYLKTIKQLFTFKALLVKGLLNLFALLPLKTNHYLGSFIGWLFLVIPNRAHHVTTTNIQICFPQMPPEQQQRLIKDSLIETGKTFTEASPMWKWDKDKLFKQIKNIHGEELLQNALNNKNGVILALPHLGNWELLGLYCSANYSTTSMYQKPKMTELDSIIKYGRERFGATLVPADNHGVRAMYKALRNNEFVCILPDQEPTKGNGVFATFFNLKAYSMTLVSRLANKTNATVIIAYTKRLSHGKGYDIYFVEVEKMLQKINSNISNDSINYLNSEMEKCIKNIPEQYQWSYKRFRTQPLDESGKPTEDYYNS